MDATQRWETEALRTSSQGRPKPSGSRRTTPPRAWVTLKEAEAETGIPTNTLRKWVRKDTIPSYLESDGDFMLRMVDLDAVRDRATKLGRRVGPEPGSRSPESGARDPESPTPHAPRSEELRVEQTEEARSSEQAPSSFPEDPPVAEVQPDTMLVPVDAWNKMLAQLGNLHEAGQQLAEARERAAKAETEAEFLRERLAEARRTSDTGHRAPGEPESIGDPEPEGSTEDDTPSLATSEAATTTTYWRYLTTGWRDRRRRDRNR